MYSAKFNSDKTACETYLKLRASYDFENVHYQSEEITTFCPDGQSTLNLQLNKPERTNIGQVVSPLL
jgi:hypothetical protein